MNIIVVGCGKIGTSIISALASEGHDLIAIDNNPAALDEVTDVLDVMGVCGNGVDCEILKEAEVENASLLIAVTDSDEFNMLCCYLARKMGAHHTIARIRNPEYNDQSLNFVKENLNISMAINPEMLTAEEIYKVLKFPSAIKVETFSRRSFEIIEMVVKPDTVFDGISLAELREKFSDVNFLICAAVRNGEVHIPDGNFVLKAGDKIGLTASHKEMLKLLRDMKLFQRQAKSSVILGASTTAHYLAKLLLNTGNSVKVIDSNPTRCKEFTESLPKADVVCGDGTQQELLLEEGIRTTESFVSLTGMDEENILISIFAKNHNVPKIVSKINRMELSAMAENLGLDCIVSPQKIIIDVVLKYVRALQNSLGSNIETLYKIMDEKAEALEFKAIDNPKIVNTPLKDLKFIKNVLIAGIIRDRKTLIPSGNDCILPGDYVVVVSTDSKLKDLTDIVE